MGGGLTLNLLEGFHQSDRINLYLRNDVCFSFSDFIVFLVVNPTLSVFQLPYTPWNDFCYGVFLSPLI